MTDTKHALSFVTGVLALPEGVIIIAHCGARAKGSTFPYLNDILRQTYKTCKKEGKKADNCWSEDSDGAIP